MDSKPGVPLSGNGRGDGVERGFFFDQYFTILRGKAGCRWFFEKPQFRNRGGDPVKEREAFDRAVAHSEETFKKVGWRQLIVTLLEKGWFKNPDMSAIKSVQVARFEDAVRLLSIENASR